MPQNGFHALVGAAVARRAWPGRLPWVLGFVLGSMLPDVDVLPLALVRLAGWWDPGIHRTLTHSVFFVGLCLAAAAAARVWSRDGAAFLVAFALGVVGHIALDLLFWFSGVNLLWPLSEWRGWSEVNLWRGIRLPPVLGNPDFIGNQLASLEPVAFALYLGYLERIAGPEWRGRRVMRFARAVRRAAWGVFPVYLVTGTLLPEWPQTVLVYAPNIVLFFPTSLVLTLAVRRRLAG